MKKCLGNFYNEESYIIGKLFIFKSTCIQHMNIVRNLQVIPSNFDYFTKSTCVWYFLTLLPYIAFILETAVHSENIWNVHREKTEQSNQVKPSHECKCNREHPKTGSLLKVNRRWHSLLYKYSYCPKGVVNNIKSPLS